MVRYMSGGIHVIDKKLTRLFVSFCCLAHASCSRSHRYFWRLHRFQCLVEVVYTIDIDDLPPLLPCSISDEDTDEGNYEECSTRECDIGEADDTT